jgi:hypothetical protein
LTKALKKGKIEPQIKAFPFRELGTSTDYIKRKPKYRDTVEELLEEYIIENDGENRAAEGSPYWKRIMNIYNEI